MKKLREMMTSKRKTDWTDDTKRIGVGSGSTLLNLACSDNPFQCFLKGCYYFLVGDSNSGKTFLSLTCFAEAMQSKHFQDYRLIYDDVENGALMDFEKFFGKCVADRVESPSANGNSVTVEDFYDNIDDALNGERPFIYVLDSQDALDSVAAASKYNENKKKRQAGKDTKGSYGDGKAKVHSEHLRRVVAGLKKNGSILIIISQTRDNIAQFSFEKKTRSGGRALKFYASLEIWSSVAGKIKKKIGDKNVPLGIISKLQVKKNRITGKDRTVTMPIFNSYGIDDIGSCVDFLIEVKYWKKAKNNAGQVRAYNAEELNFVGTRDQIIKHIETDESERLLRRLTGKVWQGLELEMEPKRKKRYE